MITSRHIDLNLLELLLQIHDTHSVSVAGSNMGLSQPATSNALARLRHMLDDPLFVRGGQGMEPTPFTERIVPEVREHLAGIALVLNDATPFDPFPVWVSRSFSAPWRRGFLNWHRMCGSKMSLLRFKTCTEHLLPGNPSWPSVCLNSKSRNCANAICSTRITA